MTTITKEQSEVKGFYLEEEDEDDYHMTPDEFGEYLKNMRLSMQLQQIEFANILGLNKNTYNAYEQKKRIPKNWEGLQAKISVVAKEYHSKKRGHNFTTINTERQEQILNLHKQGLNVVQIGFKLNLDELEITDFLKESGETPVLFTIWTSKAEEEEFLNAEHSEEELDAEHSEEELDAEFVEDDE